MRFVMNSAVLTGPGLYRYRLVSPAEARAWLSKGSFESAVGYAQTAQLLQRLLGVEIPVKRQTVRMDPGDKALVARLTFRPDPSQKGELPIGELRKQVELGLLIKL